MFDDPRRQLSRWPLSRTASDLSWAGDPLALPEDVASPPDLGIGARFAQAPVSSDAGLGATELAVMDGLTNFGQGRAWDLQRQGPDNTVDQKFIDAATVALGLYGAAAGIYPHDLLMLQSYYALLNSDFGNKERSRKYYPLPETNVENTRLGYELHRSGRIGAPRVAP